MDVLYKPQIDFILNRGTGVKACIFDDESKECICNIIPYSAFQDHNFFYFDYIHNRNRIPISDISCIVIIRPLNLKFLIEELTRPSYSTYIVLFTSPIDPFVLAILANADSKGIISEIYEINLDLVKHCSFLYTTNSPAINRISDGILSILMSLDAAPRFKTLFSGFKADFKGLSQEISTRVKQFNFKKQATVVFLPRSYDLVTPLLYDWHYHSLVLEHINYKNGAIRLDIGNNYTLEDSFFEGSKFKDIHSVGEDLKGVVKELERSKSRISNYEFEGIEETTAYVMMIETHFSMYNKIINSCMANKEASEREINIARKREDDEASLKKLLKDDEASLKRLLIHFVLYAEDWEEKSKKYPEFRDRLLRFKELYCPRKMVYKPRFDDTKDIKLSYIPPIKRIIRHLISNKVKPGVVEETESGVAGPLVLYIEGGVSPAEYRAVREAADENDVQIYVVSEDLINYKTLLEGNRTMK